MSSHFGHVNRDAVEIDCWLTVNAGDPKLFNRRPSVRVSAGAPSQSRHERSINLKLSLPIALFETPAIAATIKVERPTQAIEIDATAIAAAVRGAIGMDVDIAVVESAP